MFTTDIDNLALQARARLADVQANGVEMPIDRAVRAELMRAMPLRARRESRLGARVRSCFNILARGADRALQFIERAVANSRRRLHAHLARHATK